MPILDTNILIYSGDAAYSSQVLPYVTDRNNIVSAISLIETLGYHRISTEQTAYFQTIFSVLRVVPIDNAIIEKAITLRQIKKMSLGDALIAATAIVYNEPLISRNISDFLGIHGLSTINPL